MEIRFVNLTDREMVFNRTDEQPLRISPSGGIASLKYWTRTIGYIEGVPVQAREFDPVQGLPPPVEGTIYLVSSLVREQLEGRPDVMAPATRRTDGAVRDKDGKIVAVTRLWGVPC